VDLLGVLAVILAIALIAGTLLHTFWDLGGRTKRLFRSIFKRSKSDSAGPDSPHGPSADDTR
jgi:FtsZ-interacting cell division protein ZipA